MAPIIETSDERALPILDAAGVRYSLVQPSKTYTASSVERQTRDEDYILLDSEHQKGNYSKVDLLVPFERTHIGESWTDCITPKLLAAEGGYMPTIRMHADFLKLIKSGRAFDGKGRKIDSARLACLYEEITAVREPCRADHLDAKFGDGTITYHLIERDGSVRSVTERVAGLMEDKLPGIDLNSWLKTASKQGLPTSRTEDGSLYFWSPRENAVARFGANSGRVYLGCDRNPGGRADGLGIRVVRKK